MAEVGDLLRVKTVDGAGVIREIEAIAKPAWTALTLQNGWSDFGSGFETAQYLLTEQGEVKIRGMIGGGTVANNTIIFTLPEGYRPATRQLRQTICNGSVSCRLDILTDGKVQIYDVTDSTYLSINTGFYLQ